MIFNNFSTMLCMFELSLERFKDPGVISGLVLIILGIVLLFSSDAISRALAARFTFKRDPKIAFKILAGLMVIAGSLLALFMID